MLKIHAAINAVLGATKISEKLPIRVLTTSDATKALFKKSKGCVPWVQNTISNVM